MEGEKKAFEEMKLKQAAELKQQQQEIVIKFKFMICKL